MSVLVAVIGAGVMGSDHARILAKDLPGEHTKLEQIQIVQDLITKGIDGIAAASSNAPAMGKVLEAAVAAGIPVMTWDSDLLP